VRHHRAGKKLGRDSAHRKAMYANLAGALIEHGRIQTTVAKAKAVKPIAEKMITLGRRGDLHARRQAMAFLRSQEVVHKLFAEVAPRFKERPGGYSRIVRLGPRLGDAAEMAYLELVDFSPVEQAEEKAERRRLRLRRRQEAEELAEAEAATAEAPAAS
jgi:large subunit ribosomal protein L17